jgi:hypothetical protein
LRGLDESRAKHIGEERKHENQLGRSLMAWSSKEKKKQIEEAVLNKAILGILSRLETGEK